MSAAADSPAAGAPAAPRRRTGRAWTWGAAVVAILVALPILAVIGIAAGPTGEIWLHLVTTVLPGYVINTLLLLLIVGIGIALIGAGTAWLVTTCRFPGRRIFEWALLLPLAMPAYVIALIYVELLEYAGPVQIGLRAITGWSSPRDYWFPEIRSLGGAAAMMILVLYPYVYLLARAAFIDQSVAAMEASRTLGLSAWRSFWRVALPMARPSIAVGIALALMETLNDFGTVQVFGVNTFTTGIYEVWLGLYNAPAAAQLATVMLLFVLALLLLERSSRRGQRFHQIARRYHALPDFHLTGWRAAGAVAACGLPLLLGFLLPAAVLVDWTFLTFAYVRKVDFVSDIVNTIGLAAIAALLATVVAIYMAYAVRLSGGPVLRFAARFAAIGYAIPGSVIAVGVLIPFAWIDNTIDGVMRSSFGIATGLLLSGTVVAMTFAYLVRFMALSFGSVEASLTRVTPSMDGAARTLGHGPLATLTRVHVPLIRGGVLAAALLVFVDVMKELPATLILRPFNFGTLATRVFEYASDERFEETGLWALSIVLAGILPVILMSAAITRSRPGHGGRHGHG